PYIRTRKTLSPTVMAGKVIWKATVKANCNRDRVSSCAFIESPCVACDEWTVEEQISAVFPSFAGLLDAHVLLSEIESLTETLAGHAGEVSVQEMACHFPSLPIAGLALGVHVEGRASYLTRSGSREQRAVS